MKKIPLIALALAVCLLLSVTAIYATEPRSEAVTSGCCTIRAAFPLGGSEKLVETADAVLLYELNTDTLVYGWNIDQIIDPTGMVKILTVLVALEQGNLDDEVTVKRSTLNTVTIGAVSAKLQADEVIQLRDLLYCVMVSSANDAAAVLAEHIAGSQTAFVEMMNAKAAQLGCSSSMFANVHGLSGTQQYSTARDLAIITEAALENPLFAEMFCADSYTVPATNKSDERYILTTNYMMSKESIKNHYDSRVTGGKTAAASLTDRSLICTAEVDTSRYLCIVMSAEAEVSEDGFVVKRYGSFEETKAVLDYGFGNFAVRQVANTCQAFAQYSVSGGQNDVTVRVDEDLYTVLPKDFLPENLWYDTVMDAELLQAPIAQESVLGTLRVRYGNIILGTADLVAMHSVVAQGSVIIDGQPLEQDEPDRIDYKGLLIRVGLILAGILLVAAIVLVLIRVLHNVRKKQMYRRRKRNRRRSR